MLHLLCAHVFVTFVDLGWGGVDSLNHFSRPWDLQLLCEKAYSDGTYVCSDVHACQGLECSLSRNSSKLCVVLAKDLGTFTLRTRKASWSVLVSQCLWNPHDCGTARPLFLRIREEMGSVRPCWNQGAGLLLWQWGQNSLMKLPRRPHMDT